MNCPICKTSNPFDAFYCHDCGHKLVKADEKDLLNAEISTLMSENNGLKAKKSSLESDIIDLNRNIADWETDRLKEKDSLYKTATKAKRRAIFFAVLSIVLFVVAGAFAIYPFLGQESEITLLKKLNGLSSGNTIATETQKEIDSLKQVNNRLEQEKKTLDDKNEKLKANQGNSSTSPSQQNEIERLNTQIKERDIKIRQKDKKITELNEEIRELKRKKEIYLKALE